jgi:hypothetical protein
MVHDQIRAGVGEPGAARNTGHADRQVFDRYNITALEDQARARILTKKYRAETEVGQ